MEGLEATEILFSSLDNMRMDSEFFRKRYLFAFQKLSSSKHQLLEKASVNIIHPTEVVRVYSDHGILIVRAQNVRDNVFDFSDEAFMPDTMRSVLASNLIEKGDVVMTRSGANYGQTACYKLDRAVYACADVLIIKPNEIRGGYLSTLLNTLYGKALVERGSYGAAQPHIAPPYLKTLPIPRFANLEAKVDALVSQSVDVLKRSSTLYAQAETLLLRELGLDNLDAKNEITYTRSFKDVETASRFDAQYFHPRAQRAMAIMGRSGESIGDVAPLAKRYFQPKRGQPFEYIEIGNVGGNGQAGSETVSGEDAPSRAQWIVQSGDVITSTVRPIRRLTALIEPGQDGFVCSSGFAVLSPEAVSPELLTVYLRLPVVCEILDLHTTASLYPAISSEDLLSIPITLPGEEVSAKVIAGVQHAHSAKYEAKRLLEMAKRAVEVAIEDSEGAALALLAEATADDGEAE